VCDVRFVVAWLSCGYYWNRFGFVLYCENGFETVLAAGVFSLVVLQVDCVAALFVGRLCLVLFPPCVL